MGAYSFQKRFVPMIRSGRKCHTIRSHRRYPDKPGNVIHCYYAMRTKGCRLIGRFFCVKVQEIVILDMYPDSDQTMAENVVVRIDGEKLSDSEREQLARADGFKSFQDMLRFWDGRLPFVGHIIHWKYQR